MKQTEVGTSQSTLHVYPQGQGESDGVKIDENNNTDFSISPPPPIPLPQTTQNMNKYVTKNQVLKAEILWTLKTVTSHCSYKSNENVSDVFRSMFPDSEIAKRFTCGERKTSYLSVFGIAEHFKKQTLSDVNGHFVLLFDESLNKKMQEKQLDIHVRYWESNQEAVVTRYLGSQFMGKDAHKSLFLMQFCYKNCSKVILMGTAMH